MSHRKGRTKSFYQLRKLVGANIHKIRAERQISLYNFSRYTGISSELLDHYEIGRGSIDLSQIAKIADALEVKTASFFED